MSRFLTALTALAALLGLASPALAEAPELGKMTEIEFTDRNPRTFAGGMFYYQYAIYPTEPDLLYRVELESVGNVEAKFRGIVHKDIGGGRFDRMEESHVGLKKIDFTMTKSPPGSRVQLLLGSQEVCKARVRITRIGEDDRPVREAGDEPVRL